MTRMVMQSLFKAVVLSHGTCITKNKNTCITLTDCYGVSRTGNLKKLNSFLCFGIFEIPYLLLAYHFGGHLSKKWNAAQSIVEIPK